MSEYIYGSIGEPLANVLGEIYLPRKEIVRCEDCKRYIGANLLTGWNDVCNLTYSNVQPNGYCAWGERKF